MATRTVRLMNVATFKISQAFDAGDLRDAINIETANDDLLQEDAVWEDYDASELEVDLPDGQAGMLFLTVPMIFKWQDDRTADDIEQMLDDQFGGIEDFKVTLAL